MFSSSAEVKRIGSYLQRRFVLFVVCGLAAELRCLKEQLRFQTTYTLKSLKYILLQIVRVLGEEIILKRGYGFWDFSAFL